MDPSTSDRDVVRGDTFDQFGILRKDDRPSLPYYLLMKLPGEEDLSYLILQSFNPATRPNMTAFMVAKSDRDEYGKIVDYRLPRGQSINGLQQTSARIDQDPVISEQFTLLGQQGSEIIRGNMLVVPVEESLLFIQPIYLRVEVDEGLLLPEFKRVVVVYGEETPPIMRETLDAALAEIFGESSVPAEPDTPGDAPETPGGPDQPPAAGLGDLTSLVTEIDSLLDEADAALRDGDLGGYQAKVDEVARLVERLWQLVEGVGN